MLKVRTLFSGIGSPESALKNLEIPYELIDFCEVDKYAVKSYCAIHGVSEDKNLGDITKVWGRNLPYADLLVWGFPCQDISVAGKQRGLKEGETRSGLYYEGFRILKETKPKYSIIENVKNLTGKKFKADFESMLEDIESLGYNNYWKVLNAKDYGIPQNRERVFIVSIRKDIDTGTFSFPKGFDNGLRLKDFLEDEVDEKYYLSEEYTKRFLDSLTNEKLQKKIPHGDSYNVLGTTVGDKAEGTNSRHWVYDTNSNISTLDATMYKQPKQILETPCIIASRGRNPENSSDRTPGISTEQRFEINKKGVSNTLTSVQKDNYVLENKILQIGNLGTSYEQSGRVYSEEGISPTIMSNSHIGGYIPPKILQVGMLDIKGNEQVRRAYDPEGCSPTLNTMAGGNRQPKIIMYDIPQTVTVRKYDVNIENLKTVLREYKTNSKLTNKQIAETLEKPLTLVEHWFRQDKCFSIPDEVIWFRLKKLLNIVTDEFDKSITEFIEQEGVFEKSNRIYNAEGIAPTLTVASTNEKILEESKILRYERTEYGKEIRKQYEAGDIKEKIGNMRELSPREDGISNTLTTVQKDNLLLEPQYRIRKLTPKECWRLMGFTDEDFEKAAEVNSNSQLYKQAGNSIVTNCLFYIFKSLLQAEIATIYEENKELS